MALPITGGSILVLALVSLNFSHRTFSRSKDDQAEGLTCYDMFIFESVPQWSTLYRGVQLDSRDSVLIPVTCCYFSCFFWDLISFYIFPMQAGSHAARKLCRGRVELRPAWTPALRWRLLSVALAKSGPPLPQKSPKQLRHNSWILKEGGLFPDICQCERLNSVSWAGAATVCCNPLQSLAYLACELFRWQPRDRIRGPSWGGFYPSRQLWLHKGQVM